MLSAGVWPVTVSMVSPRSWYQGLEDFYRRRYREQRARLDELAVELACAESAVCGDLRRLRLGPDRARSHGARWG